VLRLASALAWSRSLLLLALPGCLVSFNDYPLGDPKAESVSSAGSGAGGGNASVLPGAGTDTGATAGANTASAGSATTGGSETTGGTEATGGSADGGAPSTDPDPPDLRVDDFEDGDALILALEGRSGAWYVSNDGRGQQTPRAGMPLVPSLLNPARGDSLHGAHTLGGPSQGWGALIGTAFASSGNDAVAYDVSGYQGLRLWVRSGSTSPYAAKQVRLNLRTPATIMGGGCTVCSDHFGVVIPLTSKWVQVEVPFASLKQGGYGRPVLTTPDLAHAMGVELLFAGAVSFDLWIDDIELY
jgi:hypothetical protein